MDDTLRNMTTYVSFGEVALLVNIVSYCSSDVRVIFVAVYVYNDLRAGAHSINMD